MFKNYNNQRST